MPVNSGKIGVMNTTLSCSEICPSIYSIYFAYNLMSENDKKNWSNI